jgi:hypothetical protein
VCQARSISYISEDVSCSACTSEIWGKAYDGWDKEGYAASHEIKERMIACDATNKNMYVIEVPSTPAESTRCSPAEADHLLDERTLAKDLDNFIRSQT